MADDTGTNIRIGRGVVAGGAILSLGSALVGPVAPAGADTFEVTNTNDSGDGSLRDAVEDANLNAGPDEITFAAGLGTITVSSQIDITDDLTITGPATVSGGGTTGIFYLYGAGAVTIDGLTFQNGDNDYGGAIEVEDAPGDADLTIRNSTFTGNNASEAGGAIQHEDTGSLVIEDSVFTGNSADIDGGAISVDLDEGPLEIVRTTISGNTAGFRGGGVHGNVYEVLIDSSTISGNTAGEYGGGLYLDQDAEGDTTLTILSSTISGNTAGETGGGMVVYDTDYVLIAHSTIAGNSAVDEGGAIIFDNFAEVTITHTILADNDGGAGYDEIATNDGADIVVTYSLIEGTFDTGSVDDVEGNIFDQDPALAALADNGGPTQTRAIAAGSPAHNVGNPSISDAPDGDQRGLTRIVETIDIGAFEVQPEPETPTTTAPPAIAPSQTPAAQPTTANPDFTG